MSNPRTSATLLPDSPQLRDPVTEPDAMEAAILADLRSNYQFEASAGTGLSPERPDDEVGFAVRSVLLSELRTLLGVDERSDEAILEALDLLTAEKKLKVTDLSIKRWINAGDMLLICLLGGCLRGWRKPYTQPQLCPRFFGEGGDFKKGDKALAVKASARALRKQAQERLHARFPHLPDPNLESALHRDQLVEEARLRTAIMNLASRFGDLDEVTARRLLRLVDGKDDK